MTRPQPGPRSAYPKYKVNRWLDPETDNVLYGIDRKAHKGAPWMHCCKGREPMFYQTAEVARAAIRDLIAKNTAKPHPDPIQALREIAPGFADLLVILPDGRAIWQENKLHPWWGWADMQFDPSEQAVIYLRSGDVLLPQQPDGTVIEVSRGEWDV